MESGRLPGQLVQEWVKGAPDGREAPFSSMGSGPIRAIGPDIVSKAPEAANISHRIGRGLWVLSKNIHYLLYEVLGRSFFLTHFQ